MRLAVQKYQHFFIADDSFLLSDYCIKPCSKKNLTNEGVLFSCCLSRNRCVTDNAFETEINRFRIFTGSATLVPDKASVAVMGTFALHNLLRLKSRDSYTRKDSSDKIQNNISLLLGEWRKNRSSNTMNDLKRAGKTELKCQKISNFITGECH